MKSTFWLNEFETCKHTLLFVTLTKQFYTKGSGVRRRYFLPNAKDFSPIKNHNLGQFVSQARVTGNYIWTCKNTVKKY